MPLCRYTIFSMVLLFFPFRNREKFIKKKVFQIKKTKTKVFLNICSKISKKMKFYYIVFFIFLRLYFRNLYNIFIYDKMIRMQICIYIVNLMFFLGNFHIINASSFTKILFQVNFLNISYFKSTD
jgi:hypothetical protein